METTGHVGSAPDSAARLLQNVETVVRGKTEEIRLVLTALVCGGHVLLEDVPGTAKTVLARAIAGSVDGAAFSRIQCTPDLQPTDVTGLSVFNQRDRDFEFRAGPVFANVLLVDEINRAMPKTQSALLEAMAEQQVTIDGVTRELPEPFLVLATENPIEQEGTFPLPEAQLDRFFLRTALGYPSEDDEVDIVEQQLNVHPLRQLRPVLSLAEVRALRAAVEAVYIDPVIRRWVIQLVRATRAADGVAIGASVRGSLALERAARAWALLRGREYVTPVDVEDLFLSVVIHRIVFTPSFVATAREIGWTAAADRFRAQCVEIAPRPGAELEPEDDSALAVAR
jgi:MoxR-like ATPase